MELADANRYRVVRLFPDHATSPIWFPDPLDYDDARLSTPLRSALEAWEQFYYAHIGYDTDTSAALHAIYNAEGRRLARTLADEIGPEFDVDLILESGLERRTRWTGAGVATNPAASAAFRARRDLERADDEELARITADAAARGLGLGWSAHAPRTGKSFVRRHPSTGSATDDG